MPARMKRATAYEAGAPWAVGQPPSQSKTKVEALYRVAEGTAPHLDIDNCDAALIALYGESELTHRQDE